MYRITLIPIFLSLCGCIPAHIVQVSGVEGSVFDSKKKTPIANSTVYCAEYPENKTNTTQKGNFELSAKKEWHLVPLGSDWMSKNCSLVVEASGYEKTNVRVRFGDDTPKIIYLERKP